MKKSEGRVRLADYIRQLRQELTTAVKEGEEEELRFAVEEIEVELNVTRGEQTSGEGGWNYLVVVKGGGSESETYSQKMRLKLKPLQGKAVTEAKKSGSTLLSDDQG